MSRSTSPITEMQALGARSPFTSLFGMQKGSSALGSVSEVRTGSVRVRLANGEYGWAHGPGLGIDGDEQPQDRYREGDLVVAQVTGFDLGNECLTLSIRSRLSNFHQRPAPEPLHPRHPDLQLNGVRRGSRLWARVQEVKKTGLRVIVGSAAGWIDYRVAGIPDGAGVADRYRTGQFVLVQVTGVNYAGGEFTAQIAPSWPQQRVVAGSHRAIY